MEEHATAANRDGDVRLETQDTMRGRSGGALSDSIFTLFLFSITFF